MTDMPLSAQDRHRRNIRLPNHDYSTPGTYFVTMCVTNRACIFGHIDNGEMCLSDAGTLVDRWWIETDRVFASVESDSWIVMPNHVHALIRIGWTDGSTLAERFPDNDTDQQVRLRPIGEADHLRHLEADGPVSLGRVIQWFKSATTAAYAREVSASGWTRYPGSLWQRNYYEHIIRDESELERARAYVSGNPGKWSEDQEYRPVCAGF